MTLLGALLGANTSLAQLLTRGSLWTISTEEDLDAFLADINQVKHWLDDAAREARKQVHG